MRISIFSILLFLFILPRLVYASEENELQFAFTSDKTLWIKTGELDHQIWEDCIDTEFTWSQDGNLLAYSLQESENYTPFAEIWIYNKENDARTRLKNGGNLKWAPLLIIMY